MASNNETRLLIETTNDQDHKVVGVTTKTGRNLLQKNILQPDRIAVGGSKSRG